ncbi:MAG TPA: 8-amino-7-oxononanoate synthase [Gammaproteobacteria bacterium]|nr:8-amino-7-oxononanoate synthase [Gammaproteobacteria bacterium]
MTSGAGPVEWERRLAELKAAGLYRTRRVVAEGGGVEVVADGRRCLSFCGNDYLGLRNHPAVVRAFRNAAGRYGVGSGAAHLISGHTREHHALEEALADSLGRPRALLFSTGYMANLGIACALAGRGDAFIEDRLNHASLLDAARLSGARLGRYVHADTAALRERLERAGTGRRFVATDAVFSMDGDIAPLPDIARLCVAHGACLIVDDAHGFGVLGARGYGTLEHFALDTEAVPVLMVTLGKALGTFGAAVAGSEALIETLIQSARTYVYTTAPPPAVAAAARAALALLGEEPWRRDRLRANVARFRAGAASLGLAPGPSTTPIQPLAIGDDRLAVEISERLFARGLWVTAIRPPTVPAGGARLRVTLSAAHDDAHIDRLLDAIAACGSGLAA